MELERSGHVQNIYLGFKSIAFADELDMERERKGEINDDFHISSLSNCVDHHAIY